MIYLKTFSKSAEHPCKAHIVLCDNPIRPIVMVENKDGLSDWPIIVAEYHILYDHPEKFPTYAKQLVRDAFAFMNSTAGDNLLCDHVLAMICTGMNNKGL